MKTLLNISDLKKEDILEIYDHLSNYNDLLRSKPLKNLSLGLIFEKYSTRTRLSFQVGINQLRKSYRY